MLSLDPLLGLAFLHFTQQEFHVLILTHPPEYIISNIKERGVWPESAAVELADSFIGANRPSTHLHLALVGLLAQGVVLVLAPQLPQFLVSIIVLQPAARQLECELGHVEFHLNVDVIQLFVEESKFLYLDEGLTVFVHLFIVLLFLVTSKYTLVISDVTLVDIAEGAELVVFFLLLLREHRIDQVLLIRFNLSLIGSRCFANNTLFDIVEWCLLLQYALQTVLMIGWTQ